MVPCTSKPAMPTSRALGSSPRWSTRSCWPARCPRPAMARQHIFCMAYKNPEDQRRCARLHYLRNRAAYLARAKAAKKVARQAVLAAIRAAKSRPCMDCERSYPLFVMQFDHRPGERKSFTISRIPSGVVSRPLLDAEIQKCDVVCANCHAIRTYSRLVRKAGKG